MLRLAQLPNELQQLVTSSNWSQKRVIWTELVHTDIQDFPHLTLEKLRLLTLGVYQIKQATSYTWEHTDEERLYKLSTHRECKDSLQIKIQSRYTLSKIYNFWITYTPTVVTQWYCQCKISSPVVGCCAHVASVIWFVGYYRLSLIHISEPTRPY